MTEYLTPPEPWMLDAVCASADPDLWYPEHGASAEPAKKICDGCPCVTECLTYALLHNELGIWGGVTERQRRRMRRPLRGAA